MLSNIRYLILGLFWFTPKNKCLRDPDLGRNFTKPTNLDGETLSSNIQDMELNAIYFKNIKI